MKMPVSGPNHIFSHYGVVMYLPKLISSPLSRSVVGLCEDYTFGLVFDVF